jgi:ribosomal protein S18 acetylase RimI-like enzyme
MPHLKIRDASFSDIININKLNSECLPVAYTYWELFTFILNPYHLILLIEDSNGRLIAYLIGEYNYDSKNNFHILSIGTKTEYRSQGLGNMLIDNLKNILLNDKQYCNITLHVHDQNDLAIKFYKRNGFNITTYIDNYYLGVIPNTKSQNAYIMKKIIRNCN